MTLYIRKPFLVNLRISSIAVSYTHLDVYKRQVLSLAASMTSHASASALLKQDASVVTDKTVKTGTLLISVNPEIKMDYNYKGRVLKLKMCIRDRSRTRRCFAAYVDPVLATTPLECLAYYQNTLFLRFL